MTCQRDPLCMCCCSWTEITFQIVLSYCPDLVSINKTDSIDLCGCRSAQLCFKLNSNVILLICSQGQCQATDVKHVQHNSLSCWPSQLSTVACWRLYVRSGQNDNTFSYKIIMLANYNFAVGSMNDWNQGHRFARGRRDMSLGAMCNNSQRQNVLPIFDQTLGCVLRLCLQDNQVLAVSCKVTEAPRQLQVSQRWNISSLFVACSAFIYITCLQTVTKLN